MNKQFRIEEEYRISLLLDSDLLKETLDMAECIHSYCPEATESYIDIEWQYDILKAELNRRLPKSFRIFNNV